MKLRAQRNGQRLRGSQWRVTFVRTSTMVGVNMGVAPRTPSLNFLPDDEPLVIGRRNCSTIAIPN